MIKRGEVILHPYSKMWIQLYEKEKKLLINTLGNSIVNIEHVGSTSIPGLKSKPIIDIVIGLKYLDNGYPLIEKLKKIGYVDKGSLGKSKRFFLFKLQGDYELYHLHLVEYLDDNWMNFILFKKYLVNYDKMCKEYQTLKEKLANESHFNRDEYTKGKAAFILKIVELAKKEQW